MTEPEIVDEVVKSFRCFGHGSISRIPGNPIAVALADRPPQFAAGVDVTEVVRFVLEKSRQ